MDDFRSLMEREGVRPLGSQPQTQVRAQTAPRPNSWRVGPSARSELGRALAAKPHQIVVLARRGDRLVDVGVPAGPVDVHGLLDHADLVDAEMIVIDGGDGKTVLHPLSGLTAFARDRR